MSISWVIWMPSDRNLRLCRGSFSGSCRSAGVDHIPLPSSAQRDKFFLGSHPTFTQRGHNYEGARCGKEEMKTSPKHSRLLFLGESIRGAKPSLDPSVYTADVKRLIAEGGSYSFYKSIFVFACSLPPYQPF